MSISSEVISDIIPTLFEQQTCFCPEFLHAGRRQLFLRKKHSYLSFYHGMKQLTSVHVIVLSTVGKYMQWVIHVKSIYVCYMNEGTLCKQATIHQVTSKLATSCWRSGNNQSVGSSVPVNSWWLWPRNKRHSCGVSDRDMKQNHKNINHLVIVLQ